MTPLYTLFFIYIKNKKGQEKHDLCLDMYIYILVKFIIKKRCFDCFMQREILIEFDVYLKALVNAIRVSIE
jgi:hypothetical protein